MTLNKLKLVIMSIHTSYLKFIKTFYDYNFVLLTAFRLGKAIKTNMLLFMKHFRRNQNFTGFTL